MFLCISVYLISTGQHMLCLLHLYWFLQEYSKQSINQNNFVSSTNNRHILCAYCWAGDTVGSKAGRFTFIKLFTLALQLPLSSLDFKKSRDKTGVAPLPHTAASSKNLTTLVAWRDRQELLEAVWVRGARCIPVDVWNFPVRRWSLRRFHEPFKQQQQRSSSRLKLMVNIPRGRSREDWRGSHSSVWRGRFGVI